MAIENRAAHDSNPIGKLLLHAYDRRKDSKVFVPHNLAVSVDVGPYMYRIEGGERIWMKKDSETTFYVTLENANVQLTIEWRKDVGYVVRRQVIGSTHRVPGNSASVGTPWNRSAPSRHTPSS